MSSGNYKVTVERDGHEVLVSEGWADTITDALVRASDLRNEQWLEEQQQERDRNEGL